MKEKIECIIEKVLIKLYKNDKELIGRGVCERAIVFRFGIYLQRIMSRDIELNEYNLDCEYNRNMDDLKRTENYQNGRYPDLIIHKRGSNLNNLLVIEFKKRNSSSSEDIKKINDFMSLNGEYKYRYGISIVLKEKEVIYKIKEFGGDWIQKKIKL